MLVYLITWWSLGVNSHDGGKVGPDDGYRFRRVVWIGLAVGTIATTIFHFGVNETESSFRNSAHNDPSHRSISRVLTDINLYLVGCVYMSTRLFVNLSQVLIPLYLHETLASSAKLLAILPLCIYLSSFFTSFFVHHLSECIGKRGAYFIGALAGLGACVWIRFRDGPSYVQYEIYGVATLLGIAGSILLVTSLGLTASFIGADTNRGALVYGLMSFTDKLSNGVAVMAIQHLHSTTCTQSTYYRDALSYVCSGAAIFSVLILCCIKTNSMGRRRFSYEHVNEQTVTSHDNHSIND